MSAAVQLPVFDFDAISDLKSRMADFTLTFDKFIAAGRDQLRRERHDFTSGMLKDRQTQRATEDSIESMRVAQESLETQLASEREEVEEMQRSIDEYTSKKNEMDLHKSSIERQDADVRESMALKKARMQEKRETLNVQNRKNRPELSAWEQQLGLTIDGAGSELLRFTFARLHPRDAQMPHWFTVDVRATDYRVQECHPRLPTMDQALRELNETRDFSAFLKRIRREFKALY